MADPKLDMRPIPSALADRKRPAWAGEEEGFDALLARADDPEPAVLEDVALARSVFEMARWAAMSPAPEVRALAAMLAEWCEDDVQVPLDRWLGTTAAGRGSMRERVAITKRNIILRQIARLQVYADAVPTAQARLLATRWKRWHVSGRQTRDAEGRAFAEIGGEPLSAMTIRDILLRKSCT